MSTTPQFDYLRRAATKYGGMYIATEMEAFVANMDDGQLAELIEVYETIQHREDAYALSRWIESFVPPQRGHDYHERAFSRQVGQLLSLFEVLGDCHIQPFAARTVRFIEEKKRTDWSILSEELQYLREPAEKFGVHLSEAGMLEYLENANEATMESLARIAEQIKVHDHFDTINEWLDRFPMTDNGAAWQVYCLLGLLDHAGLL